MREANCSFKSVIQNHLLQAVCFGLPFVLSVSQTHVEKIVFFKVRTGDLMIGFTLHLILVQNNFQNTLFLSVFKGTAAVQFVFS